MAPSPQLRSSQRNSSSSEVPLTKCTVESCAGSNLKPVQCYDCDLKFHSTCVGLKDAIYKCIIQSASTGVRWHCSSCLSNRDSTSKASLETFKKSIENEIKLISTGVEQQLKSFKESLIIEYKTCQQSNSEVTETITSYASVLSENVDKQKETAEVVVELKKDIQSLSNTAKEQKLEESEAKLRELKKMNLMLFQMPESTKTPLLDACKEDFVNVISVIDPESKLKENDVVDLYRIGIKDGSNARPIVIRFTSSEKRNEILRNRALCFKKGGKDVKVFVAPDRTTQQRKEHKLLQAELQKRRTDEKDENLVIRNGKIVSRRPFRFKPQQFWGSLHTSTTSSTDSENKATVADITTSFAAAESTAEPCEKSSQLQEE